MSEKMNASPERIEEVDAVVRDGLTKLVTYTLHVRDPQNSQEAYDTVRGIHHALSFHLGIVENLLASAADKFRDNIESDRSKWMVSGQEHHVIHRCHQEHLASLYPEEPLAQA